MEEKDIKKSLAKEKPAKGVTYVMKVTHLAWGNAKKNHFYSENKPLISKEVMGKYSDELDIWLKNNWIEEGSY